MRRECNFWSYFLQKGVKNVVFEVVRNLKFLCFQIEFKGFQINPDGCVVIKGFDASGEFKKIRDFLCDRLDFLSKRQSSWFHIPIGRILEPVGAEAFGRLGSYISFNDTLFLRSEFVDRVHLISEKQWYMETRTTLMTVFGEN